MYAEIKWPQQKVLHVRQMKLLELKILQVILNKIYPIGNTSCKTNEISSFENT